MNTSEELEIISEILSTSKDLNEIDNRLKIVVDTLDMDLSSKYYYIPAKDTYYIDTQPLHALTKPPAGYIELTRAEYYEKTLPDWGFHVINELCE